jgi:hypothetical protein
MRRPGADRGPSERPSTRAVWIAGSCAVVSLIATLAIAFRLDAADAFAQNNTVFKDDAATGLSAFSEGWTPFNTLRHPNLHFFVGHPIRLGTDLLTQVMPVDGERLRHGLALLVSPAAGALVVLVVGFVLAELPVDRFRLALLTGLLTASFSHLVFASIPTHFALSSLMVALFFALLVKTARPPTSAGRLLWLALGFVATGVTSINVISWTVFYSAACLPISGPARWKTALIQGLAGAVLVIFSTAAFNTVLSVPLYGQSQLAGPDYLASARDNTALYLRGDVVRRLAQFPEALATSFVPGALSTSPIPNPSDATVPLVFGLSRPSGQWGWWIAVCAAVWLLAGLGIVGHWRRPGDSRLWLLALAQILICVLLLAAYGDDSLFLYSQHWQPAAVIAIAGAALLEGRARQVSTVLLVFLLVCAAARSALLWREVFDVLAIMRESGV